MNTKNQKKKIMSFFLVIILLVSTSISITADNTMFSRATIFVDDDAESTWYDATHVRSIQEGIDNASSGDIVFVYNGTYYEHIIVNKSVMLQGENQVNTIIDGEEIGDVVTINADNCSMHSFTVKKAGNPPSSHSGILITKDNTTITNMIITNNDIYGINIISSLNTIKNNTIKNNGEGIRLYYANTNTILQNTFQNNYYGMRNWYSTQNSIKNNTFTSNSNYGIFHKACQQTILQHNQITDSLYGIRFYDGTQHLVSSNTIFNNTIGLYQDIESNNHTIYNNYFANDDNIEGTGTDNIWNISQTTGTNIINGSYLGGNYWNDYVGYDTNGDGIGDTNIPFGPGDYLPLTLANNPPIANFSFSPLNPSTLTTIQFNDTSTDPEGLTDIVNWTWSFGDGTNSYLQNPTHSYENNGNFTVNLSVRDTKGVQNNTQQIITVSNIPPVANFTYSPLNPITNDIVTFNSTSLDADGSIVNWTWDFNDGTYEYGENTTHSFDEGTYNVVLWITDDQGALNVTNKTITVVNILPTADFSYNPVHPSTADVISFQDLSSDRNSRSIVNWTWDFDDGTSSFDQHPMHQYTDNGTYSVMLTVMDNDGASNTTSKNISVSNVGPMADFTFTPYSPTTNDTIQFNDTSVDTDGFLVNWTWNFGDGNRSYLQHPTYQYTDNGNYTVSLNITDDDGINDTVAKQITVGNMPPVSNFSFSPLNASTADTIQFNDTSTDSDGLVVNWTWSFGDGTSSFDQHPMHQYTDNGNYSVSLTVMDNDGAMNISTTSIIISNVAPVASFSFSPSTPSSNDAVQFTDTSTDSDGTIVNWTWSFDDGTISYDQHPTHFFDDGTYNVTLTIIDDDGATHTTWMMVTVTNAPPAPNFTWNPSYPTTQDMIQFVDLSSDRSIVSRNWDFGDGNFSSQANPLHQYAENGNYMVTLYVSDDDGATNSTTKTISVSNVFPTANFSVSPLTGYTGELITFNDSSSDVDGFIISYQWSFGDGNTSTIQHPTHAYADDGSYLVNLTVTDDDNDTDSKTMIVSILNQVPIVNFTLSSPVNATTNDVIIFTDTSTDSDGTIVNWTWNFGDGNISYNQHPMHQYTDNGTYTVTLTVTDDDNATNTTSKQIIILNEPPQVSFTFAPVHPYTTDVISFSDTSSDTDGIIVNWTWNFGDGNSSYMQNPTYSYLDNGSYLVSLTVTDDDNHSNTTSQLITVYNVAPTADFTVSSIQPEPFTLINFTDYSSDVDGNIVNWTWSFGDGNTSYLQHPTHAYATKGIYTISLTVTDNDGANSSDDLQIIVTIPPTANFSFSPSIPITQQPVQFTDSSTDIDGTIMNWTWDFDDGNSSYQQHPAHQFSTTGSYNVTLTVTDDMGIATSIIKQVQINYAWFTRLNISLSLNESDYLIFGESPDAIDGSDQLDVIRTGTAYTSPYIYSWFKGENHTGTLIHKNNTNNRDLSDLINISIDSEQQRMHKSRNVTNVSIIPNKIIAGTNDYCQVSIFCEPGLPIEGFEFDIEFNASRLQVDSITQGNIFDGFSSWFNQGTVNNSNGYIDNIYGLIIEDGNVSHSGFLANITFTVLNKSGSTVVKLNDTGVADNSGYLPVITTDGTIMVDENLYTPYLKIWNDFKQFPDFEKSWDFYVHWNNETSSANASNITLSWNTTQLSYSEYATGFIHLIDVEPSLNISVDMLSNKMVTFTAEPQTAYHFQITSSTNLPPTANFSFNPSNPFTAEIIQFNDTSVDADGTLVNWTWDFDDGNTSYLQHPTHAFADDGTYLVTLTATDDEGSTDSITKAVMVKNTGPTANFTWTPLYPTTIDTIQFTSISSDRTIMNWTWSFGDGNTSYLQHPMHQYMDNGTYMVTLTVTDDDGATDTTSKNVVVSNIGPTANFTFLPDNPTTEDIIQFTDTSIDLDGAIVNWTWNFDDGNSSYEQHPSYQYEAIGNYTVCLTVTDTDNLTDTKCITIQIITFYNESIDVNQSSFDRGFPIRHAIDGDWAGAQNFTASVTTLTRVEIYLRQFGSSEFNLTVELRKNSPEGELLDSVSFLPSEIPSTWSWFTIDFNDTLVNETDDLFIVIPPAPTGTTTSFGYEWGYALGNQYDNGSFWFTRNSGNLWRPLPSMYEFTFKTYGYSVP